MSNGLAILTILGLFVTFSVIWVLSSVRIFNRHREASHFLMTMNDEQRERFREYCRAASQTHEADGRSLTDGIIDLHAVFDEMSGPKELYIWQNHPNDILTGKLPWSCKIGDVSGEGHTPVAALRNAIEINNVEKRQVA